VHTNPSTLPAPPLQPDDPATEDAPHGPTAHMAPAEAESAAVPSPIIVASRRPLVLPPFRWPVSLTSPLKWEDRSRVPHPDATLDKMALDMIWRGAWERRLGQGIGCRAMPGSNPTSGTPYCRLQGDPSARGPCHSDSGGSRQPGVPEQHQGLRFARGAADVRRRGAGDAHR